MRNLKKRKMPIFRVAENTPVSHEHVLLLKIFNIMYFVKAKLDVFELNFKNI